jgi:hypothetical protein
LQRCHATYDEHHDQEHDNVDFLQVEMAEEIKFSMKSSTEHGLADAVSSIEAFD